MDILSYKLGKNSSSSSPSTKYTITLQTLPQDPIEITNQALATQIKNILDEVVNSSPGDDLSCSLILSGTTYIGELSPSSENSMDFSTEDGNVYVVFERADDGEGNEIMQYNGSTS